MDPDSGETGTVDTPRDDYARIERALACIERDARRQPALDEMARAAGLSPAHFQRVFTRWAGISPKRFVQALTVVEARARLERSRPVLEVALDVGLSGPGRLHDLTVTCEAMTPGEIGRAGEGITVSVGTIDSPFGPALAAFTERGLCRLEFEGAPGNPRERLRREWPRAQWREASRTETETWSRRIFERGLGAPLALHLRGTNFQLQVWRALLRVPDGCLVDYGALARAVGRPEAARAVGNAVGANPIAVLVPCHRVLRRHGELGGYRWGTARKLAVLGRELCLESGDQSWGTS